MPTPLDYARPTTFPKTLALPAMIFGLISGPLGLVLAIAIERSPEPPRRFLPLALCGPLGVAFVFSLVAMLALPAASRPRDRTFAGIGVIAPVAWGLLFAAFFAVTRV